MLRVIAVFMCNVVKIKVLKIVNTLNSPIPAVATRRGRSADYVQYSSTEYIIIMFAHCTQRHALTGIIKTVLYGWWSIL